MHSLHLPSEKTRRRGPFFDFFWGEGAAVHRSNAFENLKVRKLLMAICDPVIIYSAFSAVSSSPKLPKESTSFLRSVCDPKRRLKFRLRINYYCSVLHSPSFVQSNNALRIANRRLGIIWMLTTRSQMMTTGEYRGFPTGLFNREIPNKSTVLSDIQSTPHN